MSTAPGSLPPLFAGLVDDAALFPPARTPMPEAVGAHLQCRQEPRGALVDRFLCPVDRWDDFVSALPANVDEPVRVGLILAGVTDPLPPRDPRARVVALEVPTRSVGAALDALPAELPCFLEVPASAPDLDHGLAEIAAARAAGRDATAKVRCGGLTAEAFPTAEQLAGVVGACVAHGVPFKATAGLHHAVRHHDAATGFTHHGFLNLLLAVHSALTGGDVTAVLLEQEPAALTEAAAGLNAEEQRAVRAAFTGYGSCSTFEPYDDLVSLDLIRLELPR